MIKKKAGNPRNSAKFMILGAIANLEQMRVNPKLEFTFEEKKEIMLSRGLLLGIIERWGK